MMPFDSAEFFKNSIDCVKGNIVKWRKEQEQRNLNLELLENKIRDSENRMYVAEMKLEMMTERKEVAENEAALLKEAYEKVYCFWKCFDLFIIGMKGENFNLVNSCMSGWLIFWCTIG